MKTIVVTGGIGSGKSVACRILHEEYGWPIYNADAKVKELYSSHPTLLSDIEKLTGECLRDAEGTFLPSRLAGIIFSDPDMLEKVEALVFPALTGDFEVWKADNPEYDFVLFESATILEKPSLHGFGDFTVLIDAPVQMRKQRAMERDSISSEALSSRLDKQTLMNDVSNGFVIPDVEFVVMNDGSTDDLYSNLMEIGEKIVLTKKL